MVKEKILKINCSSEAEIKVSGFHFFKRRDRWRMTRILPSYSFLLILTVFFLIFSGSSWAVIPISSIVDLQKIGNDPNYPLNGEYELTQSIDASTTINWNNGAGFAPIGTTSNRFMGKFDGKGYKITRLHIFRPGTNYVGLFGSIGSGSEVKNLKMEDCNIRGYNYVGCVVGENSGGTVSNCYCNGSLGGGDNIGGLVGMNSGTVRYCHVSFQSLLGHNYVGGLIGQNYGGTVLNCYNIGSVSGSNRVGGLIGGNGGTVSNCYSRGSVIGGDNNNYIGGLIGLNQSTVSNCYSTGSVSCFYNCKYVGGLIGGNDSTVSSSYWDIETSGYSSSAGGEGKTTTEMKQQATFVSWDFVNTWGIIENSTYPYFSWQYIVPDVVGITQAEATNMIENAGFVVGTVGMQCGDTITAGNVISQDPIGGVQLPPGGSVNLIVSTGLCFKASINNIPSKIKVYQGGNLLLTVKVQGGSGTLRYQWYFERETKDKEGGEPIPDANGNALLLKNLNEENTGWYWCQVSDNYDVVETQHVHLIVEEAEVSVVSGYVVLVVVVTMIFIGLYQLCGRNKVKG